MQLIQFLDLPIQPRADRTLSDFWPLRARCAGNIHTERQPVLIHEVALHTKGTRVHTKRVTAFVEKICRYIAAADITPGRTRTELLILFCIVSVKCSEYIFTAHRAEIHTHA